MSWIIPDSATVSLAVYLPVAVSATLLIGFSKGGFGGGIVQPDREVRIACGYRDRRRRRARRERRRRSEPGIASIARATAGDTETLAAMMAAARSRGLGVCGEGIEDQAALDVLRRCGATLAQGFHLGRPMPAEEFERTVLHAPS